MPERDWRLRIQDISVAMEKIERYTAGMTLADFQADDRTIDAVLRNFEVIGEAAGHVPPHVTAAYPDIPWAKMRALGEDAGVTKHRCSRVLRCEPADHLGNHRPPSTCAEGSPSRDPSVLELTNARNLLNARRGGFRESLVQVRYDARCERSRAGPKRSVTCRMRGSGTRPCGGLRFASNPPYKITRATRWDRLCRRQTGFHGSSGPRTARAFTNSF
jgi:hypothetical protein